MRYLLIIGVLFPIVGCENTEDDGADDAEQASIEDCRSNDLGCRAPFECLADDDGRYECRRDERDEPRERDEPTRDEDRDEESGRNEDRDEESGRNEAREGDPESDASGGVNANAEINGEGGADSAGGSASASSSAEENPDAFGCYNPTVSICNCDTDQPTCERDGGVWTGTCRCHLPLGQEDNSAESGATASTGSPSNQGSNGSAEDTGDTSNTASGTESGRSNSQGGASSEATGTEPSASPSDASDEGSSSGTADTTDDQSNMISETQSDNAGQNGLRLVDQEACYETYNCLANCSDDGAECAQIYACSDNCPPGDRGCTEDCLRSYPKGQELAAQISYCSNNCPSPPGYESCVQRDCAWLISQCQPDPGAECSQILTCIGNCAGDQLCVDTCPYVSGYDGQMVYNALAYCIVENCSVDGQVVQSCVSQGECAEEWNACRHPCTRNCPYAADPVVSNLVSALDTCLRENCFNPDGTGTIDSDCISNWCQDSATACGF